MSMQLKKSTKGFTLIELMIVVAIIGILAAIAIPNFLRFQLKSKSSEGKVNLAAIRTAEESYLAESTGWKTPQGMSGNGRTRGSTIAIRCAWCAAERGSLIHPLWDARSAAGEIPSSDSPMSVFGA